MSWCVLSLTPPHAYIKKICHAEELCKCRPVLLLALLYIYYIITKMFPGQGKDASITDQHGKWITSLNYTLQSL